jgi:radical SAM protein with 4Fe4S-binding SPASM domain
MEHKEESEKVTVAGDLICLHGKHGDMVVGNAEKYSPVYVENGDSFLRLLDNIANQEHPSIEQDLLELLRGQKILVTADEGPQEPPAGTPACCGTIGEQILILPLAGQVEDSVYVNVLNYVLKAMGDHGSLVVKFHGRDPVLHWEHVKKVAKLIDSIRSECRPDIQLRFHFDSCLKNLSDDILDWIRQNDVSFTVFYPLSKGLSKSHHEHGNIEENAKKLYQAYATVSLITPAVKDNISELLSIAEHHANFNTLSGFEFPAIRNPNHPWEYGFSEDLPDADEYSQVLVDIYKGRYIEDDLFSPVNELRHRVANGGYSANCSCLFTHAVALRADGNIYPCLAALYLDCLCMGNVTQDSEDNLRRIPDEFKDVQEKHWGDRARWRWRGLCGLHCPLLNEFGYSKFKVGGECLIEEYFYKPRLRLVTEIIWDMVKEISNGELL